MLWSLLRYFWIHARGYRLRPWKSPYLRWRMETYWGIPAESITARRFWKLLRDDRKALLRFLKWADRMRTHLIVSGK